MIHYVSVNTLLFVFAGMSARMKTLERSSRSLKSEKNHLQDEIARLQENLTAKDKELRAARNAYRDSQDEITVVTDKSVCMQFIIIFWVADFFCVPVMPATVLLNCLGLSHYSFMLDNAVRVYWPFCMFLSQFQWLHTCIAR